MIGHLLHYNCAESEELAICTRSFVYKGPEWSHRYNPGDTLITVEWVTPVRVGLRPSGIFLLGQGLVSPSQPIPQKNTYPFPDGVEEHVWYNFKWFKELSST